MKHVALITLTLMLLVSAIPADARKRHKKQEPKPEEWPEEVPDYIETPAVQTPEAVQAPDFMRLEDDAMLDYLMSQPILGESMIDAATIQRFIARHNPDFDIAIAETYLAVGNRYGIRGDIALCQSILETGWFRFADGTSVSPDQHNYCGLGVTKFGQKGQSFDTVEQGVTAQMQHLFAYACKKPLPEGEPLLDSRFKLVSRGIAPTWAGLSGRWAANSQYARSIMRLYIQLHKFSLNQN